MPEANCGIYQILHKESGKRYIGSSKHINLRLNEHRYKLSHDRHHNKHLQASWHKYGRDSFRFETVFVCEEKDLEFYEDLLVNYYKSNKREFGFNLRIISRSNLGMPVKLNDQPGDKYNKLTPIEPREVKRGRRFWLCKCDCGVIKEFCIIDVRKGHSKSCGCLVSERQREWLREQHKKGPWNKKK